MNPHVIFVHHFASKVGHTIISQGDMIWVKPYHISRNGGKYLWRHALVQKRVHIISTNPPADNAPHVICLMRRCQVVEDC